MRLLKRQVIVSEENTISTPRFLKKLKENLNSLSSVIAGQHESSKSHISNLGDPQEIEEKMLAIEKRLNKKIRLLE